MALPSPRPCASLPPSLPPNVYGWNHFPPELSTGMARACSCGSVTVDELVPRSVPTLSTISGWSGTSERSSRNGTSRGSYAAGLCHLLWQHGGSLPFFVHQCLRSPMLPLSCRFGRRLDQREEAPRGGFVGERITGCARQRRCERICLDRSSGNGCSPPLWRSP
jgi:hypothetical protein